MMSEEKKLNINEEYEKLVPPTPRESLFEDSKDYESLRQYIIDQPRVILHNKMLPFSEVKLTSYLDYIKADTIDKEKANGRHIFYLKQSSKGKSDFCDAAGYFVRQTGQFVLLSYSYIVKQPSGGILRKEDNNLKLSDGIFYVSSQIFFRSPETAASYVLGKAADMNVWHDSRDKGLAAYYKELEESRNTSKPLNSSCKNQNLNSEQEPRLVHEFYLMKENAYYASGYYDAENDRFILKKGSKLSVSASPYFSNSQMGETRDRIIGSSCLLLGGYYVLQKDIICSSATTAASFVKGKISTYVEWEDKFMKVLADYYPERYYQRKTSLK